MADNADGDEGNTDGTESNSVNFSEEMKKAVADGIAEAFASHQASPTHRKTVTDTSTVNRFEGDKTVMDMSAEIDKDDSKTASQKWSAQLALWKEHKNEM
jgi:hypothetical protein